MFCLTRFFQLSNISVLSVPDKGYYVPDEGYYVPDEGYSRNASCTLYLIHTFLFVNVENLSFNNNYMI
jgi:hypothetical protein